MRPMGAAIRGLDIKVIIMDLNHEVGHIQIKVNILITIRGSLASIFKHHFRLIVLVIIVWDALSEVHLLGLQAMVEREDQ